MANKMMTDLGTHVGGEFKSHRLRIEALEGFSETVTEMSLVANQLSYKDENGSTVTYDLSTYLDDTNLARVISGTYDSVAKELVFTRDDASTFSIDASMFFDDTNLVTSVNGQTGAVTIPAYSHPTHAGDDFSVDTGALTGATVISDIDINVTTDTNGHVTDANGSVATRTLTLADLGYTGATDANKYVHPTHTGDDINIDTGALSGATVISDLDFNVTTDTNGHVTDANATVATRNITAADVGALAVGGKAADSDKLDGKHADTIIAEAAAAASTSASSTYVPTTSAQALRATDALTVSGDTITIHKGDGTSESVTTADLDTNTWRGIQNNLTSTSTTESLSAAQGKILQDNKLDKTAKAADSDKLDGKDSSEFALAHSHPYASDTHNHDLLYLGKTSKAADSDKLDGKDSSAFNQVIGIDTDINTSGANIVDNIYVTDGVITSMGTRTLTLADLGYTGETNATADQTASEILTAIKTVDGAGSGLDADKLDGKDSSEFATSTHTHSDLHSHSNKTVLDSLGINASSELTYNGNKVDTVVAQRDVYNGLDSTDTTISLSAAQGKILNDGKLDKTAKAVDSDKLDGIDSTSFLRSDTSDTFTDLSGTTLTATNLNIGSSNKIKFSNNDYIRYDDANGVGRYHFDSDGGTNNASVQAATFVGSLQGNADTATNADTVNSLTVETAVPSGAVFTDTIYSHPSTHPATMITTTDEFAYSNSSNVQDVLDDLDQAIANVNAKDPVITLTGDVTGSGTMTNLGNVSITATVADDSHNHTIANIDGLQTALDNATMPASEILTAIKTVDGSGSGLDADLLDGKDSSAFNQVIGTDTDINTSGATIIDNIYVTDGVITSMGTRNLTPADIGAAAVGDVNSTSISADDYATSTVGGTIKARLSGSDLYITLDGSNA